MSRETTYAGMIGDWQRLLTTLEANSAEVPQLEPFRVKLVGMVNQALDVTKQQQADLKASKQAASKQMRQIATDAQRLATAVRSLLKEHYGIRDEKLAAFGLQPFRGRKKVEAPADGAELHPAHPRHQVAPITVLQVLRGRARHVPSFFCPSLTGRNRTALYLQPGCSASTYDESPRPETVRRSPGKTTVRGGEPPKAGMLLSRYPEPSRPVTDRRARRSAVAAPGGSPYARADHRTRRRTAVAGSRPPPIRRAIVRGYDAS